MAKKNLPTIEVIDLEAVSGGQAAGIISSIMGGVSGIIKSKRGQKSDDACNCQSKGKSDAGMNPMMLMIMAEKLKK